MRNYTDPAIRASPLFAVAQNVHDGDVQRGYTQA
jgi:hypothetical protein